MDTATYFKKQEELLALEEKEALLAYEREVQGKSMQERKQRGITWFPVDLHHKEFGFGENFYLAFDRTNQLGKPHPFQVGDRVAVAAYEKGQATDSMQGVITAVWTDRMKVAFHADELPEWMEMTDLGIDLLFDDASFKEMKFALGRAIKAEGRLKELIPVILGEKEAYFNQKKAYFPNEKLNLSQQEAVKKVWQAQDIAIIHGPPGTGKTTTLVQAIKQCLDEESQVLVCAPSNVAVDLLTERLAAKGLKTLRIGNPARVSDDMQLHTLEAKIAQHPDYKLLKKLRRDAEEYRSIARKYKRNFGKEEREQRKLLFQESKKIKQQSEDLEKYLVKDVVDTAQVITATLVGAANKFIRGKQFSTVFIDEAGQALAPACWIPITKSHKVVLAGDHLQLPPTVKSQEAAKQGLETTLLEYAIHQQPSLASLLDTQYRMNEQIMAFSSSVFYDNKLKADASVAQHQLKAEAEVVTFIDTAGCGFEEGREGGVGSYFNEGEVGIVFGHLQQLLENNSQEENLSVGIISPYRAQVAKLQESLKEAFWEPYRQQIRIHSVDGFQGQEQDVIYISLVRCNEQGKIGFLQDTRRMNVALTRARKRLVIIGDSATLGQHAFYQQFLAYIDEIGAYHSAWEFM